MARTYTKKSDYWTKIKAAAASQENKANNNSPPDYVEAVSFGENLMSLAACGGGGSNSTTRSVRLGIDAATAHQFAYPNIRSGILPYQSRGNVITNEEIIELCQKAYCNFAVFRNAIELCVEFANAKIIIKGKNDSAKKFLEAWFKKINLTSLKEQFFREWYRSGNVFLYRIEGKLTKNTLEELKRVYNVKGSSLPLRYILLNPARINIDAGFSYDGSYVKMLTSYEIIALKNRSANTPELIEIYNSFPKSVQQQIDGYSGGIQSHIYVPLDTKNLKAIFYKKQDYEPLATPMGFPVLNDIEWKLMMQRMDMALTRSIEHAFLLITTGDKDKGINPKSVETLKTIFSSPTVGRVVIHDYSTKAEWIIPDIKELLGSNKYEIVNQNIREGLQSILLGEDRFGNSQIKAQVFMERLNSAREVFLNEFLIPEVKAVAKVVGLKNIPEFQFEKVNLQDPINLQRLYVRLAELGLLTPEQVFMAIENGILPNNEGYLESQEEYKKQRDNKLFYPLVGGSRETSGAESGAEGGRPSGTKGPKTVNTVSRISQGSLMDIEIEKTLLDQALQTKQYLIDRITEKAKEKYGFSELDDSKENMINIIARAIFANEEHPHEHVDAYLENPKPINKDIENEMMDIMEKASVDEWTALAILKSRVNK